ncbi:PIN domain-containing protein [Micromonospora peucetia]|uniref:PIN domain-containing protein n=1 Tax=Micromonospora peucetia TaxID=47871 RepID=UPI0033310A0B
MALITSACIILDTNQWDRVPMLRHPLAASLLHGLRQRDMMLMLPDLVRREVELHLIEKHEKAQNQVSQAIGEIRQIMGTAADLPGVDASDVRRAFQNRLRELGDLLGEVSSRDEDYVAAGEMVLSMTPPNSRTKQQFKDSLLWRLVLRVAEEADVIFVSNDLGYYDKGGEKVAPELIGDVEAARNEIKLLRSIEDLLTALELDKLTEADPDLFDSFEEGARLALQEVVESHGTFRIDYCESFDTERFITENPNELALTAKFSYLLVNPDLGDASDPIGVATGTASAIVYLYDAAYEMGDVDIDEMVIEILTPHKDFTLVKTIGAPPEPQIATAEMKPWVYRRRL